MAKKLSRPDPEQVQELVIDVPEVLQGRIKEVVEAQRVLQGRVEVMLRTLVDISGNDSNLNWSLSQDGTKLTSKVPEAPPAPPAPQPSVGE